MRYLYSCEHLEVCYHEVKPSYALCAFSALTCAIVYMKHIGDAVVDFGVTHYIGVMSIEVLEACMSTVNL